MELLVLAFVASVVAWMWHRRISAHKLGPADPYMVWILRFTDRQAYRTF